MADKVLLQIIVILCTARVFGFVLQRLGQPFVVSEMLSGLAPGTVVFGAVVPSLQGALFAPASLPALQGLVQVGVVLFMFIVGLELRLPTGSKSHLGAALWVGLVSVLLPLGLGVAVAPLLYERFAPPGVAYLPFAAFIA